MKTNPKKEKKSFFFFLVLSFSVHLLTAFLFLSSNYLWSFFREDKFIISPTSIRVDIVALPDLPVKKETAKKQEKPIVLPIETKKKPETPKKEPEKQKNLKKEEEKHQPQDSQKTKQSEETKSEQKMDSEEANKGNQLVKGEKDGEKTSNQEQLSEIRNYMRLVANQTKINWNLPKYLTDIDLKTEIEIKINKKGDVTHKQIVSSSGNDFFDSFVLKAIENSTPYPSPPNSVRNAVQEGIVFSLHSR